LNKKLSDLSGFLDFFTEHLFTSRGHTRNIVWETLVCDHLLKSIPMGKVCIIAVPLNVAVVLTFWGKKLLHFIE
jgi:cell shape-determining protein MreD